MTAALDGDEEAGDPGQQSGPELGQGDEGEVALRPVGRADHERKAEQPDGGAHELAADAIEGHQRREQGVDAAELPADERAVLQEIGGGVQGGAVIGLALPLSFAMAGSVSVYEILIWGPVTLVLQIAAYRIADIVLRDLPKRIEQGEMGAAVLLVSIKIAAAAINAAAVSG